jgi:hypothetical protein
MSSRVSHSTSLQPGCMRLPYLLPHVHSPNTNCNDRLSHMCIVPLRIAKNLQLLLTINKPSIQETRIVTIVGPPNHNRPRLLQTRAPCHMQPGTRQGEGCTLYTRCRAPRMDSWRGRFSQQASAMMRSETLRLDLVHWRHNRVQTSLSGRPVCGINTSDTQRHHTHEPTCTYKTCTHYSFELRAGASPQQSSQTTVAVLETHRWPLNPYLLHHKPDRSLHSIICTLSCHAVSSWHQLRYSICSALGCTPPSASAVSLLHPWKSTAHQASAVTQLPHCLHRHSQPAAPLKVQRLQRT